MSSVRLESVTQSVTDIPLQPASKDIWDKKYRLKSKTGELVDQEIDDTYKRVARALADTEEGSEKQAYWHERFLWALRRGVIPAGRITSNAGATAHKPATSTINCTVSGTIQDSMDGILDKVHEAGLTLKAGCGIGYEFSTLRPRGAYVSGAGAYTSGPLSFMDIYDRMCFTVSSAGGRRGAQMATFEVAHPDVMEFVRAKREDGRLRQFNLSLLITDEFMEAVKSDGEWPLSFPISEKEAGEHDLTDEENVMWRDWPTTEGYVTNDQGMVACRVYKQVRAKGLWDVIMSSTYDYAEPGFILIDRVNEMNNNWFCENIRATNPCVTADTWVHTASGPRQVHQLLDKPVLLRIDGTDHMTTEAGFFKTATKQVVKLRTKEGFEVRLTEDHKVRKITRLTRYVNETQWCEAGELLPGDRVLLNDHRGNPEWQGAHTWEEGFLVGLLLGDGSLESDAAVLSAWQPAKVSNGPQLGVAAGVRQMMSEAESALAAIPRRAETQTWHAASGSGHYQMRSASLLDLCNRLGLQSGDSHFTPAIERSSSEFARGLLRGLFDAEGVIRGSQMHPVKITLRQPSLPLLRGSQRLLLRLGIVAKIQTNVGPRTQARGRDATEQVQHELVVDGDNVQLFSTRIGFSDATKAQRLKILLANQSSRLNRERFVATVDIVTPDGEEDVYDVQVPGINTFDANGLHAHNCGEQPLPPYGSCLLGSVNLTRFVENPFTDEAKFNWDEYKECVRIFTRMLDNVVEINGLPLYGQRDEILRKRRHGMGYTGLGSTLTMMCMKYGSPESLAFTEDVTREMSVAGWETAVELAREKGPAPVMEETFEVTPQMLRARPEMVTDGFRVGDSVKGKVLHARYSRYMNRVGEVAPELVEEMAKTGARFTHHTSIAPTGTISLSLANNASNGIEPSFAHHYSRNVIREGRKSKERVEVYSFELLAYRELVNPNAMPYSEKEDEALPDYFVTAEDITPRAHVDIQAAAQRWIDSSISKTANVPTDYPYEDFKDIYLYAYEQGLKGCTTFRFNPEAFQGVLVKENDLENTRYTFELEDGSVVEVKGNEEIEYDGETHTAANLFDALKEGYYGKF